MLKIDNKRLKFILPSIILILLLITNFFGNVKNIYSNNFDTRINSVYGFCDNESIGYLKYLKTKYKLNNNPTIINYTRAPNVSWAIINPTKIKLKSDQIILLNYPGEIVSLRHSIVSNKFYVNNLHFYKDKINKIDKVVLLFNSNVNSNNISLDLYSETRFGKKYFLKKFDNAYMVSKNEYHIDINLKYEEIYPKDNHISFKINNLKNFEIIKIKILAKNKFNISDYRIIDNHEKCFLIKKK